MSIDFSSEIINTLVQRGHLPKPSFYHETVIQDRYYFCATTIKGSDGFKLWACGLGSSKHKAKTNALKSLLKQLNVSRRQFNAIERHDPSFLGAGAEELKFLMGLAGLARFQIYYDSISHKTHLCLPETDLRVTDFAPINACKELIRLLRKRIKSSFENGKPILTKPYIKQPVFDPITSGCDLRFSEYYLKYRNCVFAIYRR